MYKLPKNIDLNFLIGKELMQIALGISNVILRFEDRIEINLETDFIFDDKNMGIIDGHLLFILLSKKILNLSLKEENSEISLEFEDNHNLTIYDDGSKYYQSYHVFSPKTGNIVV